MGNIRIIDNLKTEPGNPYLFGATLDHKGCNFALFSKNAKSVSLLLFNSNDNSKPSHIILLDNKINKTGDVWHIYIQDIKQGQQYGYIIDGPYEPNKGHRFNKNKLLVDPYTKAVTGSYNWNKNEAFGYIIGSDLKDLSFGSQKNYDSEVKSVIVDCADFDWEGDKQLNIPLKDSIIYEAHVRAFTQDPSSKVKYPGTYLGLIEKIPYLKKLGITTIELLPVHEFNELENTRLNPVTKKRLKNFWGYSSLAFFAPESWYSSKREGIAAVNEFKKMVKALHKAGIEVILDVVYNHSGEGNELGPTLSFKGLDNSIYYMLENGRYYKNYSGCGNTLNCNHPVVKRLIKDSLRYWVVDMHIDGFRFDLAAILGRDIEGKWVPDYSVLSEISHDPILSNTKIIAEGWDAAGLYKVGGFPEGWAEWNGKFRDDVRSFIKGDNEKVKEIANRITGSADLFYFGGKKPYHSINFTTCHDGFTLNDLVSYNEKHNLENGENNNDGSNNNISWNCGYEGGTNDEEIIKLRDRQMKNFIAILMLSQGTPMILSGDEIKFSKKGNNNTYCHDNNFNWLDWNLYDKNKDFFMFFKYMINFRKKHSTLRREKFFTGKDITGNKIPDISWHGVKVNQPNWDDDSHTLAFMLDGSIKETGAEKIDNNIYVAINSYWEGLDFELPFPGKNKKWHLAVNTYKNPAYYNEGREIEIKNKKITVKSRSIIICLGY